MTAAKQSVGSTRPHNDIGQLDTLTAPGSKVWDYTYDSGNRLVRVDIPNGMHTEYTYDPVAIRTPSTTRTEPR